MIMANYACLSSKSSYDESWENDIIMLPLSMYRCHIRGFLWSSHSCSANITNFISFAISAECRDFDWLRMFRDVWCAGLRFWKVSNQYNKLWTFSCSYNRRKILTGTSQILLLITFMPIILPNFTKLLWRVTARQGSIAWARGTLKNLSLTCQDRKSMGSHHHIGWPQHHVGGK